MSSTNGPYLLPRSKCQRLCQPPNKLNSCIPHENLAVQRRGRASSLLPLNCLFVVRLSEYASNCLSDRVVVGCWQWYVGKAGRQGLHRTEIYDSAYSFFSQCNITFGRRFLRWLLRSSEEPLQSQQSKQSIKRCPHKQTSALHL